MISIDPVHSLPLKSNVKLHQTAIFNVYTLVRPLASGHNEEGNGMKANKKVASSEMGGAF